MVRRISAAWSGIATAVWIVGAIGLTSHAQTSKEPALYRELVGAEDDKLAKSTDAKAKVKFAEKLVDLIKAADDNEVEVKQYLRERAAFFAEADIKGYRIAIDQHRELIKSDKAKAGRLEKMTTLLDRLARTETGPARSATTTELLLALFDLTKMQFEANAYDKAWASANKAKASLSMVVPANKELSEVVTANDKMTRAFHDAFVRFAKAQNKLETSPTDAEANAAAGIYRFLWEKDLDKAVPLLAKGGGTAFPALAKALANPKANGLEKGDALQAVGKVVTNTEEQAALMFRARAAYDEWFKQTETHPQKTRVRLALASLANYADIPRTLKRPPSEDTVAEEPTRPTKKTTEPLTPAVLSAKPYRLATNGLGGKQYIDAIKFTADANFESKALSPQPWSSKGEFLRPTSAAFLWYPRIAETRYVIEGHIDIVSEDFHLIIHSGDEANTFEFDFWMRPKNNMGESRLVRYQQGNWAWAGGRPFKVEDKIKFKVVVGDGSVYAFLNGERALGLGDSWPSDCWLRIQTTNTNPVVVRELSLRPITEDDCKACEFQMPVTTVQGDPAASEARLAKISAGYLKTAKTGSPFLVPTTGTPLAWISKGEFSFGPEGETRHLVQISKGFWMGQTEVTQREYRKVMKTDASRIKGSPYLPVDWVSWPEAVTFCKKLTDIERKAGRLFKGYEFRLPTEAEWEYCCRAGQDANLSLPEDQIWDRTKSKRSPNEVAMLEPNAWGLFDMHGNVMEWCGDAWYNLPKGKVGVTVDPHHPVKNERDRAVVRGGAWYLGTGEASSYWRWLHHLNANAYRGFRVVLAPTLKN